MNKQPAANFELAKSCRAELNEFKRKIRFLVKHSEDILTKIVFEHAKTHNRRRLRHLGFHNYQPCIRAVPRLNEEMAEKLNIALLALRPTISKGTLANAERQMRAEREGGAEIEPIMLKRITIWMLNSPQWRSLRGWPPKWKWDDDEGAGQ